jgi:hypothetical protein
MPNPTPPRITFSYPRKPMLMGNEKKAQEELNRWISDLYREIESFVFKINAVVKEMETP